MPHCESCQKETPSDELVEDPPTNQPVCLDCVGKPYPSVVVLPAGTILGREFDYDLSYSRREGVKASVRLGKASLTLHVPQEEIVKVIG